MTDTKIVISTTVGVPKVGLKATYKQGNNTGLFTVAAVRTLSVQQNGEFAFNYGVRDIQYSSQISSDGVYTGNLSGIVSTIVDHKYTLELSNIFGNVNNPVLVYDSGVSGNVKPYVEPVVYENTMYFTQANIEENAISFSFDNYTGPDTTVQLNFHTLLENVSGVLVKSGEPTYFVR